MCVCFNVNKNTQQLFVGCGDGTLRRYPMDRLRSSGKPFLYKWEQTSHIGPLAESEKVFKHDTIGTEREEYPLWISVVDLEDNSGSGTQYLVCVTEEGGILCL